MAEGGCAAEDWRKPGIEATAARAKAVRRGVNRTAQFSCRFPLRIVTRGLRRYRGQRRTAKACASQAASRGVTRWLISRDDFDPPAPTRCHPAKAGIQ